MKRFSNKHLILILCTPLLAIPIVFPFREKTDLKREHERYRQALQVVPLSARPPADNGPEIDEPIANESRILNPSLDSFPTQPLGPPYPSDWSELVDWVGPPERFTAHTLDGDAAQIMFSSVYRSVGEFSSLGTTPSRVKFSYARRSGSYWWYTVDDPRRRVSFSNRNKPFGNEPETIALWRKTLEKFIVENQNTFDRLRTNNRANGLYFPAIFTEEEFVSLNESWAIGELENDTGKLGHLLYIETVFLFESGKVQEAMNNILSIMRLSEHYSAGWHMYAYDEAVKLIEFAVRASEYAVNHGQLSLDQLQQLSDWSLQMESGFDYGNVLAGMQIIAQQIWVIDDPRFKWDEGARLSPDSSFIQEMSAFVLEQRKKVVNTETGLDMKHRRYLLSGDRFEHHSKILAWFTQGQASRKESSYVKALNHIWRPMRSRASATEEPPGFPNYYRRANRANKLVRDVIGVKYDVLANLRLIRAACLLEKYKIEFGAYPEGLEAAANALRTSAPLDILTTRPLIVDFTEKQYLIRANRSIHTEYHDTDLLSAIHSGNQTWMEFQLLRTLDHNE
jgi:hypothetical protein